MHLIEDDVKSIKQIWNDKGYISGKRTNSRGVAILLNNNFEYKIMSCKIDENGNYISLLLNLNSITLNLITLYDNNDCPSFYEEISSMVQNQNADYTLICGDFNVALNNEMDTYNYKRINNPRAKQAILDLMRDNDLFDIYRYFTPLQRDSRGEEKIP